MKPRQVVIAGAGPVGLSLALGLARNGCDVLVLEKNAATAEHSRAPAIWPRTQEVLAGLGVIETFLDEGIVMRSLELRDVDRDSTLFSAPLEELADQTAYPHLLILPQSRTEKLLLNALQQEPTADVRFSHQVTGLIQNPSKVEVRFRDLSGESAVDAAIVAGCDGAHSTVRESINASFEGETYKIRAALADVRIDGDSELHSPRLTTRPRVAVGIRIGQSLWRMILPFRESENILLDQCVEAAAQSLFPKRTWRPVWQSEFRLHRRMSSTFSDRRIVLAGDAAHLNSPVGGQGMNAGIQDTALLSKVMIGALARGGEEPFLEFGRQRRKEIRTGVNRFTDILTRMLLVGGGRMIRPMFGLANTAMCFPAVRRRIMRRLAMLE